MVSIRAHDLHLNYQVREKLTLRPRDKRLPQTGGTMLNATFTVTLPAGVQISWLRDQFLDFADALNLDALIEPWRPQNPM